MRLLSAYVAGYDIYIYIYRYMYRGVCKDVGICREVRDVKGCTGIHTVI